MTDLNTAALYREMDMQDAAEIAHEENQARFPLESFADEAWCNFYDPDICALDFLLEDHYEAAAFALLFFAKLSRGYNTTDAMQIERYARDISNWIETWHEFEKERLQADSIQAAR